MLAERILTPLLRSANRRVLSVSPSADLSLPAPQEEHRYMLYAHVPLTAALLMALAAHILTVFLYW